ncbi:hypothetical protein PG993_003632 [Apiospora rasikravindrae]|uniref:Uncharacterized protein n=1 Tax=Apiospora rasikravindrae TaxID=990691 RepID=A0ABR1U053_9PEZI
MSQLEDIHYLRDATISAVRQFYTFLSKMYIDESDILEPPEGGWPHMDNLRCMGKTDEVVELLRRLPYLRNKDSEAEDGTTPAVAPLCHFISWSALAPKVTPGSVWFTPDMDWGRSLRQASEPDELVDEDSIPPSVVGLTFNRWRDDKYFLLDTALGIVHWYECYVEIALQPGCPPRLSDGLYEGAPEKEWEWREEHWAWPVTDLFAILRRQFEELNFVPLGPRSVQEVFTMRDDNRAVISAVQNIYRQHGWPDLTVYRKEDCLRAVRRAMREDFPKFIKEDQEEDYED